MKKLLTLALCLCFLFQGLTIVNPPVGNGGINPCGEFMPPVNDTLSVDNGDVNPCGEFMPPVNDTL